MERRDFVQKGILTGAAFSAGSFASAKSTEDATTNLIDVSARGARGDEKKINTAIIQQAIDELAAAGGGIVRVSGGVFLSGTIKLKSNIHLVITKGTVLKASPNLEDFPQIPAGYELYDVEKDQLQRHFIFINEAQNVKISGGGTIDGNFNAYRNPPDNPHKWYGVKHFSFKGPMLEWVKCEDITMDDIQIKDSMGWNCHFYMCTNLVLESVKIRNDVYSGHSDGFDISGGHHVKINNCDIVTGDDAIVFKTPRTSRSCEKVTISNCILRSNCAAIKMGTGSWHDFRQFSISNIVAHQSNRAFQIVAFDGGNVEDVTINNLVCDTNTGITLPRPIHLDTHRRRNNKTGDLTYPDYTKTSTLKNINISNVVLRTAGRILLTAEDGCKIKNVRLHGIQMIYPWIEDPDMVQDISDRMQGSNYSPEARAASAAVVAKNVENLQLSDLTIEWPDGNVPDDFLAIYEKGEVVIDPKTSNRPLPKFHAFWGNNVKGGLLGIPLATASDPGTDKLVLKNSEIIQKA